LGGSVFNAFSSTWTDLAGQAGSQRRQHLAALGIIAIPIAFLRHRQYLAPAGHGDLLAHGHQRLPAASELRHRAVELMVREELREVMSADQPVDGQFLVVHGR